MESSSSKQHKERTIVGWKRFIDRHELSIKDSMFQQNALKAFETELAEFIEDREKNKKARVINSTDIEIPQELKDAVDAAYRDEGEALSRVIDGHEVAVKYLDPETLLGCVTQYLGAKPKEFKKLKLQIQAYQADMTAGFTAPKKGKGGSIAKIVKSPAKKK